MKKPSIQKLFVLPAAIAALTFGVSSCGNYDSAAKNDAGTGAILGAGAGAIIGHQSGNAGKGAALGGLLGGAGGYAVGNEKDKRRRY